MKPTFSCGFSLLIAGALVAAAGSDGYLRQGPPLALRFEAPRTPPPPVNELILALGRPIEPREVVSTNAPPVEPADAGLPAHLQRLIEELISKPAPAPAMIDTAEAGTAEAAPPPTVPVFEPPVTSPTETIDHLGGLLMLFNSDRHRPGRGESAVVVAPPAFLPPQAVQPPPSSRAVYTSE